jgi:tetratricopeptide (TPR) repeat protein
MRKAIAFAALAGMLVAGNLFAATADELLASGETAFRGGQYEQAIGALSAAAESLFAEAQSEFGSSTVSAVLLDKYETALVYLAVAYARTNRDNDAVEAIVRIAASERMEPRYALLALTPEVAEFDALVARLAPGQLPVNNALALQLTAVAPAAEPVPPPVAATEELAPLPVVTPKAAPEVVPAPQPEPMAVPEPVVPSAVAEAVPAPQPCACPAVPDIDAALAAQRAADQKAADERVAEVQRAAEARIAAIQAATAAPAPSPAPQPAIVVQPQPAIIVQPQPIDSTSTGSLRDAESFAMRGDAASAAAIYERVLASPSASRETLAQVATGFYLIGEYDRARYAFNRVGELKRGEEDLRYYKAVSLFETGDYYDASKEIACALPYIEVTDEVAHYREMIDEMAQATGRRATSLE